MTFFLHALRFRGCLLRPRVPRFGRSRCRQQSLLLIRTVFARVRPSFASVHRRWLRFLIRKPPEGFRLLQYLVCKASNFESFLISEGLYDYVSASSCQLSFSKGRPAVRKLTSNTRSPFGFLGIELRAEFSTTVASGFSLVRARTLHNACCAQNLLL